MFLPESPRWLLGKAHKRDPELARPYYIRAFEALRILRRTKLQAARDVFRMHHELLAFEECGGNKKPAKSLILERRSRNALIASATCMFFQQVRIPPLSDVISGLGSWDF
jgi:hypothetical protein